MHRKVQRVKPQKSDDGTDASGLGWRRFQDFNMPGVGNEKLQSDRLPFLVEYRATNTLDAHLRVEQAVLNPADVRRTWQVHRVAVAGNHQFERMLAAQLRDRVNDPDDFHPAAVIISGSQRLQRQSQWLRHRAVPETRDRRASNDRSVVPGPANPSHVHNIAGLNFRAAAVNVYVGPGGFVLYKQQT